MAGFLIDNNVLSSYFSGALPENGMAFTANVIDNVPIVSIITEIEARCWQPKDKSKETIINSFLDDSIILGITPEVVAKCVEIRRTKSIKLPDAIVGATAIAHSLTLMTADKDFANIEGLNVLDPNLM
jgi:predicted nucleic acid-binding protein